VDISNVAIIIPIMATHVKQVEYLDRCLASVQGQAGEVLVWSDGSADQLWSQFDVLKKKYRWVKFTFAGHNGKSVSRNSAVRDSMRELIYPVDADDELMPRAVQTLVEHWDGTPLYSDLIKVHDGGTEEVYQLLDFDCDLIQSKCISSVNVLHSKEQWDEIGGWNPKYNLLEDWEYNARLFWMFGGRRIHVPLVKYHLHERQHTRTASLWDKQEATRLVKIEIQNFVRRNRMARGCCGKKRTTPSTSRTPTRSPTPQTAVRQPLAMNQQALPTADLTADVSSMGDPGPGNVWAKYLAGRGLGKHDKRGMSSRKRYTRVQYGGVYAVKSQDAVTKQQFEAGLPNGGFIRLEPEAPPPPPPPQRTSPPTMERVVRTPVVVNREPMESEDLQHYIDTLESKTIAELKDLLDAIDFGPDELSALIQAEQASKNRIGAVKMLEKYLQRLSI
jgi:hypothetical protein